MEELLFVLLVVNSTPLPSSVDVRSTCVQHYLSEQKWQAVSESIADNGKEDDLYACVSKNREFIQSTVILCNQDFSGYSDMHLRYLEYQERYNEALADSLKARLTDGHRRGYRSPRSIEVAWKRDGFKAEIELAQAQMRRAFSFCRRHIMANLN